MKTFFFVPRLEKPKYFLHSFCISMGFHRGVRKEGRFFPGTAGSGGSRWLPGCPSGQRVPGVAAALTAPAPGRRLRPAPGAHFCVRRGLPWEAPLAGEEPQPHCPAPSAGARPPPRPAGRPPPARPRPRHLLPRQLALRSAESLERPQLADARPFPRVRGTFGWLGPAGSLPAPRLRLKGWAPRRAGLVLGRRESARGRSGSHTRFDP